MLQPHNPTAWTNAHVPGDILIRCAPGLDVEHDAITTLLKRYGAEVDHYKPFIRVFHICTDGSKDQELAYLLSQTGLIEFAEPNHLGQILLTSNDMFFTTDPTNASACWQLPYMGVPTAWDLTTGSNSVIVGIPDTGVTVASDGPPNVVAGFNYIDNNTNTADQFSGASGHGSVVAAIVAAHTNNGAGVAGICWNVSIQPTVIANSAGATNSSLIASGLGFHLANGANIINMSFTLGTNLGTTVSAAVAACKAGGIVMVAAGYEGSNTHPSQPQSCPGVITVTATDINGSIGSNMITGQSPTVSAPGCNIFVTDKAGNFGAIGGAGGATSFAAPQVTGEAALMLAANPSLGGSRVTALIGSAANCTKGTGQSVQPDTNFGYGIVNIGAAVQAAFALGIPSWQFRA